jgi:hypothetical protein
MSDIKRLNTWVGENYNKENRFHKKILVIGESKHSAGEEYDNNNPNIQVEDLEDYVEDEFASIRFYNRIGRLLDPEDSREVWYDVAFTNLIHTVLKNSSDQPKVEQIQNITTFWDYLEELKPEKIIVCSSRMWRYWFAEHIDDDERTVCLKDTKIGITDIFTYAYTNGKAEAIGINHPSDRVSNEEYQEKWQPEIEKFLKYNPI